jgi:hypothetical protein
MSKQTILTVYLIVLLALGGCGGGPASTLTYNGPTEQTVPMGQTLDGTDIRYVGYSGKGAEVTIGGQPAIKKIGDSLDWKGSPVAGVEVALAQRVLLANAQRLMAVGTVKITVHDVAPAAAQFPDKPLYSYKVAVTYNVRRGATIPGTLISYEGKTDQGAKLGGVSGYPYRKLGDSIGWEGRLRDNAYLDMTVRVIAYTDDFIQVGGLATVGLVE